MPASTHANVIPYPEGRPATLPRPQALETTSGRRRITALFESAERGDAVAAEELFVELYAELHRLARRELANRGRNVTLGVTTLIHEAYIKMSGRDEVAFPDHARFMAYAARVMRRLIIDHVRHRRAAKRGGLFQVLPLQTTIIDQVADDVQLQRISDALDQLAEVDAALAEIVDLKFFCGFSLLEIGAMRGISERTVQRQWEKARLFLHRAMGDAAVSEG
jgi:RNA polymerase sigma factor (TIGR02999 family)